VSGARVPQPPTEDIGGVRYRRGQCVT
jgi:hypothetical protein